MIQLTRELRALPHVDKIGRASSMPQILFTLQSRLTRERVKAVASRMGFSCQQVDTGEHGYELVFEPRDEMGHAPSGITISLQNAHNARALASAPSFEILGPEKEIDPLWRTKVVEFFKALQPVGYLSLVAKAK